MTDGRLDEAQATVLHHREEGAPARQVRDPRGTVPWFPAFFLLELAAGLIVVAALSLLSLVLDAPLLEIANPDVTPNPSKAPWYFLGLQELLHYYPPVVPSAVVPVALGVFVVALPYWVRGERRPLWPETGGDVSRRLLWVLGSLLVALALILLPAQHLPWALLLPTAALGGLAVAPAGVRQRGPLLRWLAQRTVVDWLAVWIAVEAVLLTAIGSLFRGPGWSWVWPWLDGIY